MGREERGGGAQWKAGMERESHPFVRRECCHLIRLCCHHHPDSSRHLRYRIENNTAPPRQVRGGGSSHGGDGSRYGAQSGVGSVRCRYGDGQSTIQRDCEAAGVDKMQGVEGDE